MFVIVVYDVGERRVTKVLKRCKKYLNWVQNSVLEGDISESNLKKLKMELERIIEFDHDSVIIYTTVHHELNLANLKFDHDSVIIYTSRTTKYTDREIMGLRKGGEELII